MESLSFPADLFDAENRALLTARAAYEAHAPEASAPCHQVLGELISAYERLLRETRRLVHRSDRTELEMSRLNRRLRDLASELEYRATHDPLTRVFNRAATIEFVNHCLEKQDISLIVLDIDHFKRINDSFGHPTGDRVILGVVACLKMGVPDNAHIGRVGGEEFTIVLPGEDSETSERIAQAARQVIETSAFGLPDASRITASFGVSWMPQGSNFDEAYGFADEALYTAKRNGRNQVACHRPTLISS